MFSSYKFILIIFVFKIVLNEKSQRQIKAAIFDLDGTLLDTQKLYDEANQLMINKYGNGKSYDIDAKMVNHGAPPSIGNKFLIEAFQIKLSFDELIEKKNQYLQEKVKFCLPTEGAKEITHILKHKYGLKMGLATSSLKSSVDIKLANHQEWIKSDFDFMVTGDDKRVVNGKPNPDIFLLAAKELGVSIEECIIFEDAINGIQAGLNSGAPYVVALPEDIFLKKVDELIYDKTKTELILLKSLKDFDYSLLNKK